MRLYEILSTVDESLEITPVRLPEESNGKIVTSFKVNGVTYIAMFIRQFHDNESANDGWEFTFKDQDRVGHSGYVNTDTQGASAIQVFSNAISLVNAFIKNRDFRYLTIEGFKADNRNDLYLRMLKKFERDLERMGFEVNISDNSSHVEIMIINTVQPVKEAFGAKEIDIKHSYGDYQVDFTVNGNDFSIYYDSRGTTDSQGNPYNSYELAFTQHKGDGQSATPTANMGSSATKVFGHVVSAARQLIHKTQPDEVYFEASRETGQLDLYRRIISHLQRELSEYSIEEEVLTTINIVRLKKRA